MAEKENIFKKIFKPRSKKVNNGFNDAVSMVGYEPNISRFSSNVNYSDIVLKSLQLKQRFFGKFTPKHIRTDEGKSITIANSDIARVLRNPNHYQTTTDFLRQAYFMYDVYNNCYIFADQYKTNNGDVKLDGLYILLTKKKPEIREDENGSLYYLFTFDGYSYPVRFEWDEIIVWKNNIEDNQYIGGGDYNDNANKDLWNSLDAYHQLKDTTVEAAKLGCTFDGIIQVGAYAADPEKPKAIRDQFVADLRSNKGGIAVLDAGSEYKELQRKLSMVDSALLAELKENAVIHGGVTLEMLKGKFTQEDKDALYENWLEPAATGLEQAMSKILFSQWQTTHGDQIVIYPRKAQLMTITEATTIIKETVAAGILKIDEYREMIGFEPLPDGEGDARPRGFNNLDGTGGEQV